MSINIDELTLGQVKSIQALLGAAPALPPPAAAPSASPLEVGRAYFIRTVTYHYVGRLVSADAQWLVLEEASWVADSGRFADALAMGELSEVEPYPGPCGVGAGAVVDWSPWNHPLPRVQK